MIKKTIEFTDLDGNPLVEDFWFNLNKAELAEMELTTEGGMGNRLERIAKESQGRAVWLMFDELLGRAYGIRSEDNKRFIKGPELWAEFKQTNAYDVLIMEMLTNPESASVFLIGMVPADLVDKIKSGETVTIADEAAAPPEKKLEDYSRDELLAMPQDQFDRLAGTEATKMDHAVLQIAFQRKAVSK